MSSCLGFDPASMCHKISIDAKLNSIDKRLRSHLHWQRRSLDSISKYPLMCHYLHTLKVCVHDQNSLESSSSLWILTSFECETTLLVQVQVGFGIKTFKSRPKWLGPISETVTNRWPTNNTLLTVQEWKEEEGGVHDQIQGHISAHVSELWEGLTCNWT